MGAQQNIALSLPGVVGLKDLHSMLMLDKVGHYLILNTILGIEE
ncbi:MAG: hypothetical protein DDT19_02177 [Syntrophomonadaceae bacterium]|nr:hypothetical protein [Bacillota bacterium]